MKKNATEHSNLPWEDINNFLIELESIRDGRIFYEILLNNLCQLIPYDQARIYVLNRNGKIVDAVIIKVDQWWSDAYIQYYSKMIKNITPKIDRMDKDDYPYQKYRIVSWKDLDAGEFIVDYIEPQGIKYSLCFDLENLYYVVNCGLDRTGGKNFSKGETNILDIITPHLKNLYQNLSYYESCHQSINKNLDQILTPREKEIADLLIKGLTPSNIGEDLFISQSTVYRHIANIHSKLNVSNRQELMLKLMKF